MKEGSFGSGVSGQQKGVSTHKKIDTYDFVESDSTPVERVEPPLPDDEIHHLDFTTIKTPDQLPDRVDTSHLPDSVLRSSAMEAFIQQNDDLMARLAVALRRVDRLEEKLTDSNAETQQFRERYENLKDQMLVVKEQAKKLAAKNAEILESRQRDSENTQDFKEQIRVLEIRYAELFQSSRGHRQKLEAELERFDRLTARYRKYRRNIRRAVAFRREELRELRAKRAQQEVALTDLRANLAETTNYITEQNQNHKKEIRDLAASYETQVKALQGEVTMLEEQNKVLGARSTEFDRVQNERYRIENELVVAERREREISSRFEEQIIELQTMLGKYRSDSKQLAVDLASTQQELAATKEGFAELQNEKKALIDQTEALQALWRDQQAKIETLTDQKISLQKLNQELSVSINKQRLELREANERFEIESQRFAEEAKMRETALQLLRETAAAAEAAVENANREVAEAVAKANEPVPDPLSEKSQALISKIDQAITNIYSGKP